MRGDNIAKRLVDFAVEVLKIAGDMSQGTAGKHIARQLVRSGTAGGANYEEARASESRSDFAHKINIAAKEMRESLYWLRLIEEGSLLDRSRIENLAREANELIAILKSSAKTAKSRAK
jgi:four helix bundle protein